MYIKKAARQIRQLARPCSLKDCSYRRWVIDSKDVESESAYLLKRWGWEVSLCLKKLELIVIHHHIVYYHHSGWNTLFVYSHHPRHHSHATRSLPPSSHSVHQGHQWSHSPHSRGPGVVCRHGHLAISMKPRNTNHDLAAHLKSCR